jgi:dehydrogenase/reductase SDR family member 7B
MRAELASSGVTVHVVSPGYIRTNLSMSAVTGDGTPYGKLDSTTAAGADPDDVAVTVLDAVTKGKADFTVASTFSATLAIYLRLLFPAVLRKLLVQRFEKAEQEKKKNH